MFVNNLKNNFFLIFFTSFFLISDAFFSNLDYVNKYPMFIPNDYAKTLYEYKTNNFETAIFGNSTAVSAISNQILGEKYGNIGLSLGTINDFYNILEKKYIIANKEVIICANYLVFLDNGQTNDSYPFHKKFYEPYVFFYRDATKEYLEKNFTNYFNGKNTFFDPVESYYFEKSITRGQLSDDELLEKVKSLNERFGNKTIDDFKKNISALKGIIRFCENKNLKLNFVWMPINPKFNDRPIYINQLTLLVNKILDENNIKYVDYTDSFQSSYFHDLGHLDYDKSSEFFTKELLKWLEN